MKRAVLVTGHFVGQKRRGSLLWVAHHLQRDGWHVTVATVGYSWVSRVFRDKRLRVLDWRPRVGTFVESKSLTTIFGYSPIHPMRLPPSALEAVSVGLWPLFERYWARRLAPVLSTADLVICESGLGVLLAPDLKRGAPDAARIYRVNDDLRQLNAPKALVEAEMRNAGQFTRISTASPVLADRFHAHPVVTLDPMGVPRDAMEGGLTCPFEREDAVRIAVCAGTTQLDMRAIEMISLARPNWRIHVLGRVKRTPVPLKNVVWHGEVSFADTLRYVAHADIGLAPYLDRPGIEYQTHHSNRILLYRHCGLPILAPDRLCHPSVPSIIGYESPDAWRRCEAWTRRPETPPDWSVLARRLAQNAETEPPSEVVIDPERTARFRSNTVPALASSA